MVGPSASIRVRAKSRNDKISSRRTSSFGRGGPFDLLVSLVSLALLVSLASPASLFSLLSQAKEPC